MSRNEVGDQIVEKKIASPDKESRRLGTDIKYKLQKKNPSSKTVKRNVNRNKSAKVIAKAKLKTKTKSMTHGNNGKVHVTNHAASKVVVSNPANALKKGDPTKLDNGKKN